MKIGRHEFDINDSDLILDNGACYQLITRTAGHGWNSYTPVISKAQFNKLSKSGAVYTTEELKQQAEKRYNYPGLKYWKFELNKLQ